MKVKIRKDRKAFIAFYVTDEEKATIIKLAKEHDMSISDFCRKTLLSMSKESEK